MTPQNLAHHQPAQLPVSNALVTFWERIDAFVFPHLCVICDTPRQLQNDWFCNECMQALCSALTGRTCCPRCSLNRAIRPCTCTIAWDYPFTAIHSFLDYSDRVQSIMHLIKYRGMRKLAFFMGQLCARTAARATVLNDTETILPIPLHRNRMIKRGYNQAEWFARGIQSVYQDLYTCTNVLQRIRDTKTQTSLDRTSRQVNVESAFSITPEAAVRIKGRRILLVDDVITTGATTASATRTLLSAGCESVHVLSLARD